jgi:DNA mismatch repair ATPase MutS
MFGKRQLKRWLMSPLLNHQKIELRLNAIDEMMSF